MLANDLTKTVADLWAAVVSVSICRLRWKLLRLSGGLRWFGEGPDFLNRADADAVGFAQSAVDRTSLGHAHFGAVNQSRNIGRIGVAIADETSTRPSRFEDFGSE